jgi:NAD(P)-dependent dehydrogenase (short-subunit alcohol dehydrogenase family)
MGTIGGRVAQKTTLREVSMQGKVVVITGANSGIGRETTRALARKGATIVMACRNLVKAKPVCNAIKQESSNTKIEVMQLDLASLRSIREFAERFCQKYEKLDVLINNAGVFSMTREETKDGFEKTIGTNHLGPFLLTHLLLPLIKRTPEARIVNVSSNTAFYGQIDLDDLHLKKKYHSFRAYAASKLAIVFFTQELAERLKDADITVNALHPGHVATNIWPEDKWYMALFSKLQRPFTISAEEGAQTSIYLASSDEVKGITGRYFDKKKPRAIPSRCTNTQLQKGLWRLSEQLTGLA